MTIRVKIKPFSIYRDVLGQDSLEILLQEHEPTLGRLLDQLEEKYPKLAKYRGTPLLNILVNGRPAREAHVLRDGDEIALIPLPSGG